MDISLTLHLLILLLGLCFGSFFNVVIYRFPLQLLGTWRLDATSFLRENGDYVISSPPINKGAGNICFPASHCPKCKKSLKFWMNIPVISWILLGTKCFFCKQKISPRYPAVELVTGIAAFFCVYTYGLSLVSLFAFTIFSILLIAAFIDFDTHFLPDELTIGLLWFGLLININTCFVSLETAVLGAVSGYLFFYGLFWLFKWLTGKEGLGYGDFKYLGALGACFGWESLLFIVLSASTLAIIAFFITFKKVQTQQSIAFGPYLSISGIIVLFTHPTFSTLTGWLAF